MSPLAVLGYLNGRRAEAGHRGGTLTSLARSFALLSPIRAIVACPELTLFVMARAVVSGVTLAPSCLHIRFYVLPEQGRRGERSARKVRL